MSKKIPVFVVSACLMWFAYQARDFLLELYWNLSTIYIDTGQKLVNMGSGQTVVLDMPRGFISKPYVIAVRTEIIGGKGMSLAEADKKMEYPKKFNIKTFKIHLFSQERILIGEETFKNGDMLYGSTSWGALDPKNRAFSEKIYANRLPPGVSFALNDLQENSSIFFDKFL